MASAASEAFRKCSADLIQSIQDPVLLAWELFSAGVVTKAVVDGVNMVGTPVEKNTKLLSAVRDQIDVDPAKLQKLLQALRKQAPFKEVADKLESIYKNCGKHTLKMSAQDTNILSKLLQEHNLSSDKWVPLFHEEGITTKVHVTAAKGSNELFDSLFSKANTEEEKKSLRKLLERQLTEPTKTQLGVRIPQDTGSGSYTDLKQFAHKPGEKKAKDGGLQASSRDQSDVEILHASGGHALCGVLVSRNPKDLLEIRENLLSVPQDVQLKVPLLSQDDKTEEFSSEYQEREFTTSMYRLGYSATASAKAGYLGFGVCVSESEKKRMSTQHQKETYCSTVKYSCMPMASFHFKDSQLQLSADALKDLQAIDTFSGSQDLYKQYVNKFFHKYGSHAIKGHLHFGGIYWLKCYSRGFPESEITVVKRLQSQAVSALVGLSCGEFVTSVEGNVSKLKTNLQGNFSEALISKTTVEVTKMGGPQAAPNMSQWKSGLVANNSTWNVIDRGNITVPVWEIIQMNHMKSFQDPMRLLHILKVAWEDMTKLPAQLLGGEVALQEETYLADILNAVDRWNVQKDHDSCELQLRKLSQWKLQISKRSMTPRAWPVFYLSKPAIQNYLKWVKKVTEDKTGQGKSQKRVKLLMQQIVDPSDLNIVENFPDKYCISKWLYQSEDVVPLEGKEFLNILPIFLKQFLDTAKSGVKCTQQQAKIHATTCVAQVVNHVRSHLHKANQIYEDLFVVTLLYPFRYDADEKIFLCLLKIEDLEYLLKLLKEQSEEYYKLHIKKTNILRKQAYLFHLAVSVFFDCASLSMDISEAHAKCHLLYMQKTLRNELHPQIKDAIGTKCACSDLETVYDLKAIKAVMSDLKKCEYPALEDNLIHTPKVRDDIGITAEGTITHEEIQQRHPKPQETEEETTVNQIGTYLEPKVVENSTTHKDTPEAAPQTRTKSTVTHGDTCSQPKVALQNRKQEDTHSQPNMAHKPGAKGTVVQEDTHSQPKMASQPGAKGTVAQEDTHSRPKATLQTRKQEDTHSQPNMASQPGAESTVAQEDTHVKPKVTLQERTKRNDFEVLLKLVDLEKYFPQKLTPIDAVCLRKETLGNLKYTETPELLPYYIMQNIVMHNYNSRTNVHYNTQSSTNTHSDSEVTSYTLYDVHPMDGLLALIHCSDNFLRQNLMAKLSTCKLAIPFLLPDPRAQTLTFPLWAMRSIVMEWKSKGENMECQIVDCKAPIASFLRFSQSDISKSKMLNNVIGDSGHDFFSHWDCEGGTTKRILMDGLMEVCWYLPADKESDHFPDIVTFTNLHGDARKHDKQTIFLSQVSFVNFVLLTQEDLKDQNGVKLLQNLTKAPGGLVLMFSDVKEDDKVEIPEQDLPKMCGTIKLKKKNEARIKAEIRCQITQRLSKRGQSSCQVSKQLKLIDCAKIAKDIGICVDEDSPECAKGKQLATTLVDRIKSLDTNPASTTSVKDMMLPLQGPKMWHTWAKHDKEQHRHIYRGSRGIEQYNSEKEKDKFAVRQEQYKVADPPTPVMQLFLSMLLQHKESTRDYFLHWLKFFLDNRSRSALSDPPRQYIAKRNEMNELKDQHQVNTSVLKTHQCELDELDDQLLHTSFGLEHLLRELGQIYESVCDVSKHNVFSGQRQMITVSEQVHLEVSCLPQAAAELLVSGYPLELMDGNASHLPLTWVTSVLGKLKEMLGNKRLFILSVLGIQSTGKSTLLNTMFGLQFTVSAGRCTRGAFIQLLPLDEQLKTDIKCDYFLIVDTEGLRASEINSTGTQKHDNEMATFVIGLADVTIINIFGEAPGDMDDILQTAVHAFLRMRNVDLKSSCQFVHQNVAAVLAAAKGKLGRDKFHKKLDEITKAAAKEEKLEGRYQLFKDVIHFDDERDIWYFPTLWNGDLPMAPVNPGYSETAQKLKSHLISLASEEKKKQKGLCTIFGFQSRVKQLWTAILVENFIFSFKNTLEIAAYSELDVKYTQWSWKLQRTILDWECKNETVIRNAAFESLHCLENDRNANAKTLLSKVHEELKDDMRKFFQESKHSETLAQWQGRTEIRLDDLRAEREKQAEEHCRTVICSRKAHISIDRMQDRYREELLMHVKELVSRLDGKKLSEPELESMFEEKWTEWIQNLTARLPKVYQQDVDVVTSVERCWRELFRKHDKQIIEELSQKPLRMREKTLDLEIQEDKHLQSCRWGSSLGFTHITMEDIDYAQRKTKSFLQTANQYMQDLKKKQIHHFNDGLIYDLFNTVYETVEKFNQEKKNNFKFTQVYQVDILLTVGSYALHHFEEILKIIRKENDPIEYLKTLKVPFYKTFRSQYFQLSKEKTAADNLCHLLRKPIETAVTSSLGRMVVDDMMARPTFHSKRALKAQILMDLGEMRSFESFALYLTDAKASLKRWVKLYTEQHCSHNIGGKSRLVRLSETKLQEVIAAITGAAENAAHSLQTLPRPKKANISDWLNQFHRQLSSVLTFDEREFIELVGTEDLTDFQFFTKEIVERLHKLQESLLQNFPSSPFSQMDKWNKRPYDILCDHILGCCEQCPFCKEQCELIDPDHGCKHSVQLHRPICLGGVSWVNTEEMVLDLCSSSIASDNSFRNADTDGKWHPYKEYQTYYPNWTITPDPSREVSSYWKWFVATYSAQIAKLFNIKATEIPDTWKSLTWEEVKENLKETYNI